MGNVPEDSLAAGGKAVIGHICAPRAKKPGNSMVSRDTWIETPYDRLLFYLLPSYALPSALRTLSGVAGGSIHLPMAFSMAQMTRCVVASEWLIPFAPYAAFPDRVSRKMESTGEMSRIVGFFYSIMFVLSLTPVALSK